MGRKKLISRVATQREAARREREAAGIDNDDRGDSPLNALHDEPVPNPAIS